MYSSRYRLLALALMLQSCAIGPDFERPFEASSAPENYINASTEANNNTQPMSRWWERIDDPLMQEYVDQLLSDNLSLRQAGERILQAQARRGVAQSDYFPSLGTEASASRRRQPGFAGQAFNNRSYDVGLNTSWQIDLFGRTRRVVESADAAFDAARYDKEALTHSLIAELLNRRVSVAVNQALLNLARENVTNREQFYTLVKQRYNLGSSETQLADVYLAEENFTRVKADLHSFERQLASELYQLDVLLGKMPGSTQPNKPFPLMPPPLDVPTCLPADLLDRRPDLRASELRVKAANADIGVAIGDLYPSLSLTGTLGFSSTNTSNLFSSDFLTGSIIGSIVTRIFEGGALRANIDLQESEARELAAAYEENILNAMREVETALKSEAELNREIEQLSSSARALSQAEQVSEKRYLSGILSLQQFLETQQRRYTSEQQLLLAQQQRWNNRSALYLALGGDWFGTDGELKENLCRKGA